MKFALLEISADEIRNLMGLFDHTRSEETQREGAASEEEDALPENAFRKACLHHLSRLDPAALRALKGMLGRPAGGADDFASLASLAFGAVSLRGKWRDASEFLRSYAGQGFSRDALLELVDEAISRKNGENDTGEDGAGE